MTVYGYTRVSTDRQADEGESLGAQQRVVEGYAMMLGLKLDEIFVERGVSGSKPLRDRPEGARLLATLKEGDVLITPKLDRMFRSALDALNVLSQIASYHFTERHVREPVKEPVIPVLGRGRMMRFDNAAIAAFEEVLKCRSGSSPGQTAGPAKSPAGSPYRTGDKSVFDRVQQFQ